MPQVANDSASIVSCASCMPHHHTTLLRVKTTPTATPRRLALYLATCRSRAMSSERMGRTEPGRPMQVPDPLAV